MISCDMSALQNKMSAIRKGENLMIHSKSWNFAVVFKFIFGIVWKWTRIFFPNFVCISLMLFNLVSLWWHYCCFFHGLMLDYCFLWKIFHYVLFAIYFLCYGFLKRIDPLQRKNFNNEKIAKNKYKYIDTII